MSMTSDIADRLTALRRQLGGRPLALPHGRKLDTRVVWSLRGGRVVATIDAALLTKNFQAASACGATYAWCLAWWLGVPGCDVEIVCSPDAPPAPDPTQNTRLHWNRSVFVLAEYDRLLGDRFRLTLPRSPWKWPADPVINAPLSARSATAGNRQPEHELEVRLTQDPEFRAAFGRAVEPLGPVQRQLPIGLFDRSVSGRTHHTPGGKSQVDLWALSEDGQTLHLFELKAPGNEPLGIVPEALYYGRILEEVARGRIRESVAAGFGNVDKVVMWLLAPEYHPLLGASENSPLAWLRAGLQGSRLDVRFAPGSLRRFLVA